MEVDHFDIVYIFRITVTGMPHIANYISCRYHTAFFQLFIIREVLTQVGIVIIPLPVKAADTDSPAAIPVPSQRFYVARFYSNDRRTNLSHHIVAKVLPAVTKRAGRAKIVIICIWKSFCNRGKCF